MPLDALDLVVIMRLIEKQGVLRTRAASFALDSLVLNF